MVPQTLKLCDDGEIIIHDLYMIMQGNSCRDLDQIVADMVRHTVDMILILPNLLYDFRVITGKHVKGTADIVFGQLIHHQKEIITASESHSRRADKDRIQGSQHLIILACRRGFVFHQFVADLFIDSHTWKQESGTGQIEDGVGIGDAS